MQAIRWARPTCSAAPWARRRRRRWTFRRRASSKARKEKGVAPKKADAIFELVAKFAGYGFNKSHAAAYGLISYQTGWLKANAAPEFFAATLSLDVGNTDKLAVYVQDAKRFSVVVRPPDINRSGADFEVEGGEVLYALGAVRNVGVEAMRHVQVVREAGGPFRDLFDFAERVDPRVVNKRVMENLARAGVFDSLNPDRAAVMAAADALMGHAQALASEREDGQSNLFGGAGASGRPRLPSAEPWEPSRKLDEELAAIGFYLSGHPLESLSDTLRARRVTLYAEAAAQAEEGAATAFRMAGVLRRRQEKPSRTSEKLAYLTLSDPSGEYEAMVPPAELARMRELLEPGAHLLFRMRARVDGGQFRLIVEACEPLRPVAAGTEAAVASLRIHLSTASADMAALHARLDGAQMLPGGERGAEVVCVASLPGGREVEVRLPGRYRLDGPARAAVKTAPGVVMIEEA